MRVGKHSDRSDNTYHAVKVAILDTGLDASHRVSKDVKWKDFVEPGNEIRKDQTMHGTTSVNLILRMYVEVDLHIGRVFETSEATLDREAEQMADVRSSARIVHSR